MTNTATKNTSAYKHIAKNNQQLVFEDRNTIKQWGSPASWSDFLGKVKIIRDKYKNSAEQITDISEIDQMVYGV